MAIGILSVTYQSAAIHSSSQTISIPATTSGSTLIVLLSFQNFGGAFGNNQLSIVYNNDWDGISIASTGYTFTADTGMSNSRRSQIAYRAGVPAGLTQVVVGMLDSCQSMYLTVIEASGVNVISPLDQQGTHVLNVTNTNAVGPSLTTAFTNALFVSTGISSQFTQGSPNSGGGNSPWIKTSSPVGNTASDRVQAYMIAGPGTFNSTMNRTANNNQTYSMSSASFNPSANAFTLGLSESTTMTDERVVDDSVDLDDGISLSALFDAVILSHSQFKSLFDTIVAADSFSHVWNAYITLSELVLPTDSISFIRETKRTLSETARLQDWFSIKKKNSSNWGD